MTTVFKLRLLNGDLNGRELILPEGEFTLGEQGCDVLLPLSDGNIVTLCVNEYQVMIQVAGRFGLMAYSTIYTLPFHCCNRLKLPDWYSFWVNKRIF